MLETDLLSNSSNQDEQPLLDIEDHRAVQEWDEHDNRTKSKAETPKTDVVDDVESSDEINPKRSCLHRIINIIRFIICVIAINMSAGEILSLTLQSQSGLIEYTLRIYIIMLSSIIIFNELEWISIVVNNAILANWISRGLFYTFVGVVEMEQYLVNEDSIPNGIRKLYTEAVAWGMIGSGLVYSCMGLFCFQRCHRSAREDYDKRMEKARSRRAEIQSTRQY